MMEHFPNYACAEAEEFRFSADVRRRDDGEKKKEKNSQFLEVKELFGNTCRVYHRIPYGRPN
jgi:hypothetical protein